MLRLKTGLWLTLLASSVSAAGVGALGTGCGGDPAVDRSNGSQNEDDDDTTGTGKKDGGSAKDGGGKKLDAATASGGNDAGAAVDPGPGDKHIPCDVAPLVVAKCGPCHGAKPSAGAPMSLVTLENFQAVSKTDDSRKYHEIAAERMVETDTARKMPPPSVQMTASDTKTLLDWVKGGAEGTTDSCTPATGGGDDAGTPTGNPGGSGGVSLTPVTYTDPDIKCYEFRAFATGSDRSKPYSVPTTPDLYVAFNITPEFKGTQYIKSFRTLIDNAPVLHHWLFFKQSSAQTQGVVPNAVGAHPDGDMLAGWAPGGSDLWFDDDVGMEVSGSVSYQLEMHYNNKTGGPSPDRSGVEVCVTPNKPKNVATVSWLGTDGIRGTSATGTCTPRMTGPVHLIAGSPHMHVKGRHMKVTVNRKDGTKEVIHNEDFSFEYQRQYVLDVLLNPGDTVTTTCEYTGPSSFGKGTNDEMCYFFSTAWPAGQLASTGTGSLIHGPNACLN